jgi:hypothetical protein
VAKSTSVISELHCWRLFAGNLRVTVVPLTFTWAQSSVESPWLPFVSVYRSDPTRSDPVSSMRKAAASTRVRVIPSLRRSVVTARRALGSDSASSNARSNFTLSFCSRQKEW